MLHALQMTILINHAYGDITTTAMLKTGILKMPRIEMTLELFEIRTICALISQKKNYHYENTKINLHTLCIRCLYFNTLKRLQYH